MDASLQLARSISAPTLAVLAGVLINDSRLGDSRSDMNMRFDEMNPMMDRRFADMKDMWRSELHRFEEVLDARLKHLEER